MTYDVLTRRPVPVFAFLVGRLNVVGVPARDAERDPGAKICGKSKVCGRAEAIRIIIDDCLSGCFLVVVVEQPDFRATPRPSDRSDRITTI